MYENISNGHATEEVKEAIANTEELLSGYFSGTIGTRTDVGIGSTYDDMTPDELREHLKTAQWKEVSHPDVMPGCKAYVTTDIPGGRMGLVNVKDLPDDTLFLAEDPKSTGRISICVAGVPGPETKETFVIVGKDTDQPNPADKDRPVVFTFHPGEPVRPSLVETSEVAHMSILTKKEVMALGFDLAKVDRRAGEKIKEIIQRSFAEKELKNMDFHDRNLYDYDFEKAHLKDVNFSGANLSDADFCNAVLKDVDFSGANLWGVSFVDAVLDGVDLSGADIRGADFLDCKGIKNIQLSETTKGIAEILDHRHKDIFAGKELENIDFHNQKTLSGYEPSLFGFVFNEAALKNINLSGVDLERASFENAVLNGVDLSGADLRNTNFKGAVLNGVDLSGADIRGADLSGAKLTNIQFSDTTKGVEEILRQAPSAEVIKSMLKANPYFVIDVWDNMDENIVSSKYPEAIDACYNAEDFIFDKLHEQGRVYMDDNTAVFFNKGEELDKKMLANTIAGSGKDYVIVQIIDKGDDNYSVIAGGKEKAETCSLEKAMDIAEKTIMSRTIFSKELVSDLNEMKKGILDIAQQNRDSVSKSVTSDKSDDER